MRIVFLIVLLLLTAGATAVVAAPAHAASGLASAGSLRVGRTAVTAPVDDHNGSRIGVQLVVAGAAAGLVVGIGTAAYFLRRKLGLTAYSPDHSAEEGHQ